MLVVPHEQIPRQDSGSALLIQRIRDHRRDSGGHRHGQEGRIHRRTVRESKRNVACTAYRVHAQFAMHEAKGLEGDSTSHRGGRDGQNQGIDEDIGRRNPVILGPGEDLPGRRETSVRCFGDSVRIHGEADHRGSVLAHQRQDGLQAGVLAGHRVHQRLPLAGLESAGQGLDYARIDAQRHVRDRLHERDDFGQYYDEKTFKAFKALSPRPALGKDVALDKAIEENAGEVWGMLQDPKTYVFLAGLTKAGEQFDKAMSKVAGSALQWEQKKNEIKGANRWFELLY